MPSAAVRKTVAKCAYGHRMTAKWPFCSRERPTLTDHRPLPRPPQTPAARCAGLAAEVTACRRCPRLVRHLQSIARADPSHHNAPVPAWGPASARVLLLGLAPGPRGANRTGRAFVGDASGAFLFTALAATGFASAADPGRARLTGLRLSNVVKCLPPGNQPTAAEQRRCAAHLQAELAVFWRPEVRRERVLLALGGVAWRALWRALPDDLRGQRRQPAFSHGMAVALAPTLTLLGAFHPSPLNTHTGRLTPAMLRSVLARARAIVAP